MKVGVVYVLRNHQHKHKLAPVRGSDFISYDWSTWQILNETEMSPRIHWEWMNSHWLLRSKHCFWCPSCYTNLLPLIPPSLDLHPTFAITSSTNSLPSPCFFSLNSIAIPRSLPHLPSLSALWRLAGLPLDVNAKMYCDEMEGGSTELLEWTQASTCRAACVKRKRGGTVLRPFVSICGV